MAVDQPTSGGNEPSEHKRSSSAIEITKVHSNRNASALEKEEAVVEEADPGQAEEDEEVISVDLDALDEKSEREDDDSEDSDFDDSSSDDGRKKAKGGGISKKDMKKMNEKMMETVKAEFGKMYD